MTRYLHTMYRITDPEKSRGFYEALGFEFSGDFDIVRNGEVEATNYFFSLGDQENVLELTFNHDGRSYELDTGYAKPVPFAELTLQGGAGGGVAGRHLPPGGHHTVLRRAHEGILTRGIDICKHIKCTCK